MIIFLIIIQINILLTVFMRFFNYITVFVSSIAPLLNSAMISCHTSILNPLSSFFPFSHRANILSINLWSAYLVQTAFGVPEVFFADIIVVQSQEFVVGKKSVDAVVGLVVLQVCVQVQTKVIWVLQSSKRG